VSYLSETIRQIVRNRAEIIGLTTCGRAKIQALRLNNSLAVTVRKNWVQAGWYPPS